MNRLLVFLLCLSMTGCSGGCNMDKAKKAVGLGPSTPTVEEIKAEQEAKEAERLRLEAERAKKAQDLKDADALVAKYADQLQHNATSDGFPRAEGVVDLDPWGNPLQFDYKQEWFTEYVTVRSAGPDGNFGTVDDLIRTRKTGNVSGLFSGLPTWAWMVGVWCGTGILAFLFNTGIRQRRKASGKTHRHAHPFVFVIAVMVFAPLMFILYGLQFVGGVLGASGDFFDGFEFEFPDISIDIDL